MTLVLHEGLKRIGKCAFFGCEGLTKVDIRQMSKFWHLVDIPLTVKVIGDAAFRTCKKLETL
eukprot:scaffold7010_cov143-Cylindrotheca_fusiformis.AAC.1